jgi:hypothetical protein
MGNVYPALTNEEIAMMRRRRISSNVSAANLLSAVSHQSDHEAKHIVLCSGSPSGCGACNNQLGTRAWEYLQERIQVRPNIM